MYYYNNSLNYYNYPPSNTPCHPKQSTTRQSTTPSHVSSTSTPMSSNETSMPTCTLSNDTRSTPSHVSSCASVLRGASVSAVVTDYMYYVSRLEHNSCAGVSLEDFGMGRSGDKAP
jgi:hypothetical protein